MSLAEEEDIPKKCRVLIVGAGTTGAAAAYHLSLQGVHDVVVLESGNVGMGGGEVKAPAYCKPVNGDETDGVYNFAKKSGSSVLPSPASTVKMVLNGFPCPATEFITHHGEAGARRYLRLCERGIAYQKEIAEKVLPSFATQFWCKGSLYVAEEESVEELVEEYELLTQLGCEGVQLWDREQVQEIGGGPVTGFVKGIFYPQDAVIDSAEYARGMLRHAIQSGCVKLYEHSHSVVSCTTRGDTAITTLSNGDIIESDYVVLATGGLFTDPSLSGVLSPCYSYLVSIKVPVVEQGSLTDSEEEHTPRNSNQSTPLPAPNSPNFFNWGFSHDWCITNGYMRMSGEDHYSALKAPRCQNRCASLAKWTVTKFPYLKDEQGQYTYHGQYGVYSETPDMVPLVGLPNPNSRVCYLVGCNAMGQASLGYAASLVPGILGYKPLDEEQEDLLSLLTITRFALLPVVRG